jgi:hypothetical protein
MTDNSKKVSELPTAANVSPTDRVMILRDPAGNVSVRTITVANFANSIAASVNTSIQYNWTNTHTWGNSSANVRIVGNGSANQFSINNANLINTYFYAGNTSVNSFSRSTINHVTGHQILHISQSPTKFGEFGSTVNTSISIVAVNSGNTFGSPTAVTFMSTETYGANAITSTVYGSALNLSSNSTHMYELVANTSTTFLSLRDDDTSYQLLANLTTLFIGEQGLHTAVLTGNNSPSLYLSNSSSNTSLSIPTSAQYAATNYFLHANGSWVQVPLQLSTSVPSNSSSNGLAGTVAYDANYLYVCVGTNTWKRTALSTWP